METAEHVSPGGRQPGERLVLDRYRLLRRLGSGGFGVVWLAHDERLDRVVAVKRIPVGDEETAARAQREVHAAARLSHPGIVALYEAGSDDDAIYLVSELVRGRTLSELFEAHALADGDVVAIGMALCDALAHAHARGVIHRDVKPQNVIVPDPETHPPDAGIAKLTDFGIARMLGDDALTRTGDVVGTLAYMAPEQAEGGRAAEEADLYSLGLVIYEGLAGVNPVRGGGVAATARRVGRRLPPLARLRGDLPVDLCLSLDIAVDPRPEGRGSIADLRDALADALPLVDGEAGTLVAQPAASTVEMDAPFDEDEVGELAEQPARQRAGWGKRVVAACGAAALAGAALAWLGPAPPLRPEVGAAAAAAAAVLLPRLAWLALAAAIVAWLAIPALHGAAGGAGGDAASGLGGVALLVALAALPTALLLRAAAGAWWSTPALAPLLGAAGLAGAWPALAGRASRAWHRAALGALGAWWLVLAEPLVGRSLLLGAAPGTWPRSAWEDSPTEAAWHVVWPALDGGALAIGALWALGAAILPLLVRGRRAWLDVVAATAWAGALAGGTQAVAEQLAWAAGAAPVRGLVAGAFAAGMVAVLAASGSAPRAPVDAPASPHARGTRWLA